jgi:hypothetical protein
MLFTCARTDKASKSFRAKTTGACDFQNYKKGVAYQRGEADGKVVFYKAGSFTPFSYDFDINNDGTPQTPLGAIKKMGN